uniref:Uncharacterized protein n=1 Tax=Romanomermis culicivorax TaxID=13658 RepID=A0A915JKA0_ROMCU
MFKASARKKIDQLIEKFVRPADLTMFFEYSLKLCEWSALDKKVIVEKDGKELIWRVRVNESIAVSAYDVIMKIGPGTGFGVYGCRSGNTSLGQWNVTNRPADVHFCTRKLKHIKHDHSLFLGETVSIQVIKNGEQHLFVECPPGGPSGPFRGIFIRRLDLYGEDEEISEIVSDTCDQKHRAFIHNRKIMNGQNGHGILVVELGPKHATYVQIVTFNATAILTKECTKESIYALTCRFPSTTSAFNASMNIFKENTRVVTGASVKVSISITKPGNYSCHTSIVFTGSTFTYSLERLHSTDRAWKYISQTACPWTNDVKIRQPLEKGPSKKSAA